jgi:outer membrane receptor protein involved in Fe transport
MKVAMYRLQLLIGVLLICAGSLHAQTAVTGAVTGSVKDSTGAVLTDATVEATNTNTRVTDRTTTNAAGFFRFPSLVPGTYTITVTKTGFAKYVRQDMTVEAGSALSVDATVTVGASTATVTVTGDAPLLQTDSVEVSLSIQAKQIDNLPTFGNNVTRLTLLAPGVSMPGGQLDLHPENSGEDFNVNINGGQPNNNSHILDGVDNTEVIQGYSLLVPTNASVQEVKFTTSNYDAEYGSVSGGVFQTTTKSGTNSVHGSAFWYYRTAGFFAADSFSQPNGVPGNVWNQFGGSVGGPIKKDKLFYFADYQGMRNNLSTSSLYTSPIAPFRIGDFSSVAATNPIYDPATGNPDGTGRTQFSCNGVLNVICPERISPATTNLLALLPDPTTPNVADNNYTISRPGIFDQNQADGRLDFFASPKTLVFGKFSYFHAHFLTNNVFGVLGGGPPLGGVPNSGDSTDDVYSGMVNYQRTFSSTLQQDFRFAFSRIDIQELQLDAAFDTATKVGIPDINLGTVYTSGLPTLTVSGPTGGFTMGDIGLPFFEHETNLGFYDTWTKTLGHHALKFGGDFRKFYGIRTDVSGRGSFNFSQNITGSADVPNSGLGMASYLLGLSDSFGRDITLVQPQEKRWSLAFYGVDTWKVTPKLNVMIGLRWDYTTPIYTPDGQSVGNLNLNTGNIELTGLAGKYAGVETLKSEFAPRVGASYRLTDTTVLRGGYGRSYFLNPYGASFGTQGCCWPIKQSQTFSPDTAYAALPFTLDQGPGLPAPLPPYPSNGLIPLPDGFSQYFPGTGTYPHSYTDGWNVTWEQMFPQDLTLTVAYLGNVGRHLWTNVDVNAPVPGPGDFNPRRPYYSKFGWTTSQVQRNDQLDGYPDSTSNYNSLQATAQKRFGSALYLLSNFTWAKSLDIGTFGPQNIFDFQSNYGNSGSVRPFSWVTAAVWNLPFGRGKAFAGGMNRAAEALIGGWTLSGIYNFEGGFYFTPSLANNASLNSTIGLRPNRIGSGAVSNQNRSQWFNPSDFTVPAPYIYGNSGRDILLGPRFSSADLSLQKSFAFTEKMHLDLKWDVFNATNHTNLTNPNSSVDTSTAGQITGIVDFKRRMQVGAQFTF